MTPREEEKTKRSRRTYQIVEEFAEKFDRREIALMLNADEVKIHDPLSPYASEYKSIANLIGQCVSEFFRQRDTVDESITSYETRRDNYSLQKYYTDSKELHHLADGLQEAIQQAKSRNLIDEQREYEQVRQKNAELEARVVQLSRDLKKCRDEFEAYKRTVKPLGSRKNPEYGDVVRQ